MTTFNIRYTVFDIKKTDTHIQLNQYYENKEEIVKYYSKSKKDKFNITHLKIIGNFNVDKLPISITHLYLDGLFNNKVDNLGDQTLLTNYPYYNNQNISNLIHLEFGQFFNQPVDCLPNSILYLTFGQFFNQSVDKLPISLIKLEFGDCFNKTINNLPLKLESLKLNDMFSKTLDFLPESLKILNIKDCAWIFINDQFIKASESSDINTFLEIIDKNMTIINKKINDLPASIEQIIINEYQKDYINKIYHHKIIVKNTNNSFINNIYSMDSKLKRN